MMTENILDREAGGIDISHSISPVMDRFLDQAHTRWKAGVDEYRGGDEEQPFNGDPLQEASEEAIDMYSYSVEALKQGMLTQVESDQLNCLAYDAFKLIERIRNSKPDAVKYIVDGTVF